MERFKLTGNRWRGDEAEQRLEKKETEVRNVGEEIRKG